MDLLAREEEGGSIMKPGKQMERLYILYDEGSILYKCRHHILVLVLVGWRVMV